MPVGKQQLLCLSVCLGRLPLCIVYSISSCMRRTAFLALATSSKIPYCKRSHSLQSWGHTSIIWREHVNPAHRVRSHSGCWSPSLAEEIESSLFLAPGIAYLAGGRSKVEETTDALKRTSHRPAEAKDTPSVTLLGRTGRTAAPPQVLVTD